MCEFEHRGRRYSARCIQEKLEVVMRFNNQRSERGRDQHELRVKRIGGFNFLSSVRLPCSRQGMVRNSARDLVVERTIGAVQGRHFLTVSEAQVFWQYDSPPPCRRP